MCSQGGGPDHPPCTSPFGLGDQVGAMYFAFGAQRSALSVLLHGLTHRRLLTFGCPVWRLLRLLPLLLSDEAGLPRAAILGAVVARERFGVGQHIECSQLGAMTMLQTLGITGTLHTGRENNRCSRRTKLTNSFSDCR